MKNLESKISNLKSRKGFSLVELLVVITIIAILSVVAYTAVGGQTNAARDAKRKQDITTIQSALQLYYSEFNSYPSAPLTNGINDNPATSTGLIPKRFLSSIPKDPNGKDYAYQIDSTDDGYILGATLENDGQMKNFEAYIVGTSDYPLKTTLASGTNLGFYMDDSGATPVLTKCAADLSMSNGKIGTSNAADNCVPYNPGK